MRIISWNVNSIRAILKKDFMNSVKKLNPDILCLQEIKATNEVTLNALLPLNDYVIYCNSAEKKGYSGTALLCKKKPKMVDFAKDVDKDNEGRIIFAEFPNFYLINVYAPNAGQALERLDYKKRWNSSFLAYLKKLESLKPIIVCGDFNVAHRPIDLKNDKANYNKTAGYTQVEIDGMDALLNAKYVDSFRYFHPNKVAYTFWNYRFNAREKNIGWRIDYFLISETLINKVKSVNIHPEFYGSDHCPISLEIDL